MSEIFPVTAVQVAEWQTRPDVLGVLLVGSKSRGYNDALSDDDLEVLLTDESYALKAPAQCSALLFEGEGAEKKLIYDAEYLSLSALEDRWKSPHDLDHWPYERAKVLFDRDGRVCKAVEAAGKMDADFRHKRLLHATIDTSTSAARAVKTLKRGFEGAGHLLVARGAKALTRLIFALEWRWVPLDHWLERELLTLKDTVQAGPLVVEALKLGRPGPLIEALRRLEEHLAEEGVPRPEGRLALFLELIHPDQAVERSIHGLP